MADTPKTAPAHPAVTVLHNLVDHLEGLGHRDNPEVLNARKYLTSLEPVKPDPEAAHPAAAPHPAPAAHPHASRGK